MNWNHYSFCKTRASFFDVYSKMGIDNTIEYQYITIILRTAYVGVNLNGTNDKGRFFFPQLEIYNQAGDLIYSSHESLENARILQNLPDGARSMQVRSKAVRLAEIIHEIPVFQQRRDEILGQGRINVLSIFLQDCEACAVQEDALDNTERRLRDNGVNVLVIHLSRPKT